MKNKLLILIIIFGFLLRIIGLSMYPAGFTWDEAAIGYNAYSLLKTGLDEHSQAFPLIFKSFGDFKPGLYIYFTVLSVKLFGLSEFSTRFPSVIFGTLSICFLYILTRKVFSKKIALVSAFLLAINPIMIHFSRGAWEANLNLFLLLLICNLFLNSKYWLVALFSGLSFYAYQGAKLNIPFVLVVLYFSLRPKINNIIKPALCMLLLVMPLLLGLSSQSGRLKVFSVFSYTRSTEYVQSLVAQDPKPLQNIFGWLYHAEKYDQFRGIAQRFLNHISPRYLFKEGNWTDARQSVIYYGNFHLFEAVTILLGFIYLSRKNLKTLLLLLVLITGFIIPSALSRDIVTTVRSLPFIIPLTILSAIGLSKLISKKIYLVFLIPIILFSIIYFLDLYFRHNSFFTSKAWLYPYKQAVQIVTQNQDNYSQIYFTDKLGQPYIFFLFYQKYPPALYQLQNTYQEGSNDDVGKITGFSKYIFGPIYWPTLRSQRAIMVIGDEFELPEQDLHLPNLVNFGDIKYADGQMGLRIIGLPENYAQK